MFKPLRKIAFILILGFHLINFFVLFNDIGLFPILMIAGIIPFLEPDAPRNFFDKIFRNKSQLPQSAAREGATAPGVIVGFLSLYMAVQILVPLRQFLYPGNPAWTFEGARFAWRLKMNAKEVTMWIKARDPATGKIYDIYNPHELVGDQRWMDNMPDMILQYIQFKKETLVVMGIHAPVITVEAYARLNGRNPQPFIDKSVNLANYKYKFLQHADWIIPLKD